MKYVLALAAGVTAYYLLGTPKGKKLVTQAKDSLCDLTDSLMKKGKQTVSDIKEHAMG